MREQEKGGEGICETRRIALPVRWPNIFCFRSREREESVASGFGLRRMRLRGSATAVRTGREVIACGSVGSMSYSSP